MGMNKNGMKGQALIIAAIFIVLILIILWSVVNIPAIKSNQIEKDVKVRSEMHIMGNALDAAKLYMETALAYSTYQACYDTLRNGGWDTLQGRKTYNGYALWDSAIVHPDKQELDESLKKSIKTNLELYRKQSYRFMTDYFVNIPSYDVEVVMYDPYQLSVGAWNSSNFYIEKTQESGEHIRLEKYGFLQGEYTIDCYGIYRKGTEIYEGAKNAVQTAIATVNPPSVIIVNQGETLQNKVLPYQKKFNDTVRSALYALSATTTDYNVDVYVYSADLKYVNDGPVTGAETPVKYIPEVYVKFEITNIKDGQQFPIYDGSKVVMSPMTLVFVGKFG